MREWAIIAGLINKNIENQLQIVFEPDCASLAIQHKIACDKNKCKSKNKNDEKKDRDKNENEESEFKNYSFGKGQKYILIDAGGGTVDIAFHEILGDFGVKECHHPSGGPCGSCYIDDEFIKITNKIFTNEWMNEFKTSSPNIYTEMLMNFRNSKNKFDPIENDGHFHNIRIPYDFLSFLEEKIINQNENENENEEEAVSDMVNKCIVNNKSGLCKFNEEFLLLHIDLWREIFDVCINPIINHCIELCSDKSLLNNCKYMCLVGGLSSSSYFKNRIHNTFGENSETKNKYNFIIIRPERPMLTVVEGAALFGITKNYIQARVLSQTYGVEGALFLDEAKSIKIPDSHINAHKLYHPHHQKWRVTGIFCPIATKHDTIYTNQIIQRTTTRAHQNDSYVSVTI